MKDGSFYLGRKVSPDNRKVTSQNYFYKADDLTTHSMVFGMTGSGKTGLCLDMIEEAIGEDIPVIIIDPKGDLANLALLFPQFQMEDFKPWVSASEAAKKGLTLDEYAESEANKWKSGLQKWGIDKDQVKIIKDKVDLRIFTPGSSAGMRISIFDGFKKPEIDFDGNEEEMVERIRSSVSALLTLLEIDSDPLKSKPHILISNIIEHYWKLKRDLSIEDLIINIQKPPVKKLGVFSVDQLISEKERTELAFQLNNIIASPSFRFWTKGLPLSAESLYKKSDRVPVNIFYIAHLTDAERMFFLTLLLNEVVYWMRKQSGSGDLRYLLYMDEIFGYLPPYPKNPPSKYPMMLLLKQARAFGLGVILATQNSKDIDYKALTNMGTWFIGKLQAETDRDRVMEGLSGILSQSDEGDISANINNLITSLGKRQFIVKNIHEPGINLFQTRWAMSYLAGPLTREQIKKLVSKEQPAPLETTSLADENRLSEEKPRAKPGKKSKHVLPYEPKTEIPMTYYYQDSHLSEGYYSPHIYLDGEVIFDDRSLGLYLRKKYFVLSPVQSSIDWRKAAISEEELPLLPSPGVKPIGFEPFKVNVNYPLIKRLQSSFKSFLLTNLSLELFVNRDLNLVSNVDESQEAFSQRCRDVVDKMIDKEMEKKKDLYYRRIKRLEDRIEQEKIKISKLEQEHKSKRTEEFISIGESVLGMLLGGRSRRGFSSAARRRRMTASAASKVKMKKSRLSQLEEDLLRLQEELEDKVADIEDSLYDKADRIEPFEIRLEKNDIIVSQQAILWKLKQI
jgi:DNA helicase HerA-like ATPase